MEIKLKLNGGVFLQVMISLEITIRLHFLEQLPKEQESFPIQRILQQKFWYSKRKRTVQSYSNNSSNLLRTGFQKTIPWPGARKIHDAVGSLMMNEHNSATSNLAEASKEQGEERTSTEGQIPSTYNTTVAFERSKFVFLRNFDAISDSVRFN